MQLPLSLVLYTTEKFSSICLKRELTLQSDNCIKALLVQTVPSGWSQLNNSAKNNIKETLLRALSTREASSTGRILHFFIFFYN